jgi:hypothetical protein
MTRILFRLPSDNEETLALKVWYDANKDTLSYEDQSHSIDNKPYQDSWNNPSKKNEF